MRRSSFSGFVLLLIPILAPIQGLADPPCAFDVSDAGAAKAAGLVRDANAALENGQAEDAFGMLERAYCLNPDPSLKHGLSRAALKLDRCDDAFKDALFWVQHGDPADRSEAIRWLSTVQEQCVQVSIRSEPSGASIHVDNGPKELGLTPWEGRVRSGARILTISRPGFTDAHRKLLLPPGPLLKPIEVRIALRPGPADAAGDLPIDVVPEVPTHAAAEHRAEERTSIVIDTAPPGTHAVPPPLPPSTETRTSVVIDTGQAGQPAPASAGPHPSAAAPTNVIIETASPHPVKQAAPPAAASAPTTVVIETAPPPARAPPAPVSPVKEAATSQAAPPARPAPAVAQAAPATPPAAPTVPRAPSAAAAPLPRAAPPANPPKLASPATPAPPVQLTPEPPKPRPPAPRWVKPVVWTAIGVGAAALLVGTVLGAVAHSNAVALRSSVEPGPSIQSQVNAINASNNAADALFGIGGALAATGIGIRIAY